MVNLIRHYVAGLLVFAVLMSLYGGAYSGIKTYYGFNETYYGDSDKSLPDRIENLGIVKRLQDVSQGLFQVISPNNPLDLIGGLMLGAFGILGFVAEIVVFPVTLLGVVTGFYYIPPVVSTGLGLMVLIYVGFILLSSKLRGDV